MLARFVLRRTGPWTLAAVLVTSIAAAQQPARLSAKDEAAAFAAAGFKRVAGKWQACGDPGTATYQAGSVQELADLNGDRRPEAILTEGSLHCFGGAETGFSLVSKQADGRWRLMAAGSGYPQALKTRGSGGWPDIQVGGQGFCFPVLRWNGTEYRRHRFEYRGKACTR